MKARPIALATLLFAFLAAHAARPSIVFIYADDWGWGEPRKKGAKQDADL
ncbi:MAG: hypothetical protein Q8N18_04000 [Opitutaceae bacterium]|nr:hypothetical protein [Opitutaceae bacterium]